MMLYDVEESLKRSFLNLPLGIRRLWIASSVLWLGAYLIINVADFSLLWDGATHSSSATCAQVYRNDEERRSACEIVNGLPDINFSLQGRSNSFDPYFEKYRRDDKLLIWLGAPFVWLSI